MKKNILACCAFLVLFTFVYPSTGTALDLSAGVYTWYSWWELPEDQYEDTETDPGLVYGPTLAVSFNEFCTMTFVFLYGKFHAEGESSFYVVNSLGPINYYKYDIERYDSDTAINFKLNNYFKVYLGVKYSAFNYELDGNVADSDFEHKTFGPGSGISITIPVAENTFIIGNVGGLYLKGKEKYRDSLAGDSSFDITDYGYNTSLSLAYFIKPASTTLSLGGRYQYIKTKYDDGFSNNSRFYGVTVSAVYIFNI